MKIKSKKHQKAALTRAQALHQSVIHGSGQLQLEVLDNIMFWSDTKTGELWPAAESLSGVYQGQHCKLDGRDALICAGLDCARIATVPFGVSADFSWEAVHRIMTLKKGEFKS